MPYINYVMTTIAVSASPALLHLIFEYVMPLDRPIIYTSIPWAKNEAITTYIGSAYGCESMSAM
jgi:hypothetical protein